MSRTNGTAVARKPVASETARDSAAEMLQQYSNLVREAGSPNGAWNPDPDEQILGVLRDDVVLSPNEIKFIFLVKYCCLRQKPMGRTAWGFTETGKPLRDTEVGAFFGWDPANTMKYAKRPLAYGFVRKNANGQYGIGARVQGKFIEPKPEPGSPSEVDLLVCTDKLPRYLAEAVCSQLTEPEKFSFLKTWRSITTDSQQELNTQKQRIYDKRQKRLEEHCKSFRGKLPDLKRKSSKEAEEEAADDASDLSVQTSSVQNESEALYNARAGSERTSYIRKQSKAVFNSESSSSETAAECGEPQTTTASRSSEIAKALWDSVGVSDEALVRQIRQACRTNAPDCTDDEITYFIRLKGHLALGKPSPGGYLLRTISNCFEGDSFEQFRAQRARDKAAERERQREEEERREQEQGEWQRQTEVMKAQLADPDYPEEEKQFIRKMLGLEPQAQKAAHQ